VTRQLVTADPSVRVLVLSASGEHQDVLDAVKAGATGYLVKSASREELLEAVAVLRPVNRCSPPAWLHWCWVSTAGWPPPHRPPSGEETPQLTERETEILRLVAKG